jgi:hypothetical protein
MKLKTRMFLAIIAGSLVGAPGGAAAATITYTETATISGSLNGVDFYSNEIALTGSVNTANLINSVQFGGCCYFATLNIVFSVTDVGSGAFTSAGRLASNQISGAVGFGDIVSNRAILYTVNPSAVIGYDLSTPIGPIVGTPAFNSGFAFATSAGPLIIYSSSESIFSATSAVPIPPAVWLFGSALGLMGWLRRKAV